MGMKNRKQRIAARVNGKEQYWLMCLKVTYMLEHSKVDPRADPNQPNVRVTEERNDVASCSPVEWLVSLLPQYESVVMTMAVRITREEAVLAVTALQASSVHETGTEAQPENSKPDIDQNDGTKSGLKLVGETGSELAT